MTNEAADDTTDDAFLSQKCVTCCPICKTGFSDARTLPCLHAYCRKCLDAYNNSRLASRTASRRFKCPVTFCDLEVELDPENGANGLRRNYFINRVFQGDMFCSHCDRGYRTNVSDRYCKDCAEYICSQCETSHPKSRPPHTKHTIITLTSETTSGTECPIHKLDVNIHCVVCCTSMCYECHQQSQHLQHECHNVSTFRPLLVKVIKLLKEDRRKCLEYKKVLEELLDDFSQSASRAKTFMNSCITPELFANFIGDEGVTNRHYQRAIGELEGQLEGIVGERRRTINDLHENVHLFQERTTGLLAYATYLEKNGTDLEVANDFQSIKGRADTIWSPLNCIEKINALGREEVNFVPAGSNLQHLGNFETKRLDSGPLVEVPRLNILLLGETGAGKSTLVNAISLYSKFDSLNDAEKAELNPPISVAVKVYDALQGREKTCVVGSDTSEQHNANGMSVTPLPKAHEIVRRACIVNLIDTPGVYHTDGTNNVDADDLIADRVLELISKYREIHAICVVFKGTDNRANEKLCKMFKKIMSYLHKSALTNVIFCRSFSGVNHFSSGDSVRIMEEFFRAADINHGNISDDILFCTENSSVSFLARSSILGRRAMREYERLCTAQCWNESAVSISRLVEYVSHLPPYNVIDSVSVHSANMLISRISGPLTLIARCIINGKSVKREKTKYGNQICQNASCATIFNGEPVYERVCHERCSSLGHNWFCVAFNVIGQCKSCGHCVSEHKWTTTRFVIQDDPTTSSLQDELDAIIGTAARLSAFHRKHCLIKRRSDDDDVFVEKIHDVIDCFARSQQVQDDKSKKTVEACETLISRYKEKCASLEKQGYSCTVNDVIPMIKKLSLLPFYGKLIESICKPEVNSADDVSKAERRSSYRDGRTTSQTHLSTQSVVNFFQLKIGPNVPV